MFKHIFNIFIYNNKKITISIYNELKIYQNSTYNALFNLIILIYKHILLEKIIIVSPIKAFIAVLTSTTKAFAIETYTMTTFQDIMTCLVVNVFITFWLSAFYRGDFLFLLGILWCCECIFCFLAKNTTSNYRARWFDLFMSIIIKL